MTTDYRKIEAVNFSTLKWVAESPAKYKAKLDYPDSATESMSFGTYFHTMLLEPQKLVDYAIAPEVDRRTKEGKLLYNTFIEQNLSKTIVDFADHTMAQAMTKAMHYKPIWSQLSKQVTKIEDPIVVTEPETGLNIKGLVDIQTETGLYDLKTLDNITMLHKNIYVYRYLNQLAWYRNLLRLSGNEKTKFGFVFIEKQYPYQARVVMIPASVLDAKQEENMGWLRTVAACIASGSWPDASGDILTYEEKV